MSGGTFILWVVLPYVSITIFVVWHIWRYRHDQFGWTSRSTQLLENRLLRWGNPLFHYGALAAIGGHVLGILIPASLTQRIGISETAYHLVSVSAGTVAWAAVIAGLLILAYRRLIDARVRATTTRVDVLTFGLLFVVIALGIWETFGINLLQGGYDYRSTVAVWFRGIFTFDPQTSLMTSAPLVFQLHAVSAWFLFALWPFSRLVHAWSIPLTFLGRAQILYRSAVPPARSRSGP
ncbi:MAG TPA: respiratory nitrate reductase subunit gamma [Candidatus Saccharimonadales bacterium]|nr:respiratory nitrate reductase subunit gamma [Candidatus Saccharimonadales bacterium]